MRPIFPLSVLCLAAGLVNACKPEEVVQTEDIPTAGIRFINAVPDTGAMDMRAVDIVENSASYNVAFRSTTLLYYKPARAGSRHFKVFRTPTSTDPAAVQQATAKTVVADVEVTLEAGKLYTFILWGLSRTGSTPAMQLTMLTDDPPDPGTQVALRVINACVPALCGASADGVVDVRVFTVAQTINAPATSFSGVLPITASAYQNVPTTTGCGTSAATLPNCYTFDFRPAGGATTGAALASGAGPAGAPEAVDLDAIPGTNVAGSAVSAILVPRAAPSSQGGSASTPGIIFVWDRRPPRTCALC
jgi:uncharacterized protein DUF4397